MKRKSTLASFETAFQRLRIPTSTSSAARHPVSPQPVSRVRFLTSDQLGLAAVLIVAGTVYAYHVRSASITYDEAITLLTTSGHTIPDWSLGMRLFEPSAHLTRILLDLFKYDVHPPLYFWIVALWRCVFGGSIEAARSLSAIFVLASVAFIYRIASLCGMKWPVVPAAIYALSGAALQYATTARSYAMALLWIMLTLFFGQRKSLCTGVCAGLAVATHYFAALVVSPIVGVYCLARWKADRRWSVLTGVMFIAVCAPLLMLVTRHITARPDQYAGFGPFHAELKALLIGSFRSTFPASSVRITERLILVVGATLIGVGALFGLRRKVIVVPIAFAGFLFSFFAMAAVTHKSIANMPADYYLGVGAPLAAMLAALGMSAAPRAGAVLAVLLAAGALTSTLMVRANIREIVSRVRSECSDCVIVAGAGYGRGNPACVLYEAAGRNAFVLGAHDDVDQFVSRVGRGQTIYLIPSKEPITEQVENSLMQSFVARSRDGYFEVDTSRRIRGTRAE